MEANKIAYSILLAGNSKVGKTSFFKKLSNKLESDDSGSIGMDSLSLNYKINMKNKLSCEDSLYETKITLWETKGQKKLKSLPKVYYNKSDCIIVMYDITNKESFESAKSFISKVKKDNKYFIILVGNKVDLVQENPKLRKIATDDAISLSVKNGIFWGGEHSFSIYTQNEALTIFKNYIQEIYNAIGKKIVTQTQTQIIHKEKLNNKKKKEFLFRF